MTDGGSKEVTVIVHVGVERQVGIRAMTETLKGQHLLLTQLHGLVVDFVVHGAAPPLSGGGVGQRREEAVDGVAPGLSGQSLSPHVVAHVLRLTVPMTGHLADAVLIPQLLTRLALISAAVALTPQQRSGGRGGRTRDEGIEKGEDEEGDEPSNEGGEVKGEEGGEAVASGKPP